MLALRRTVAFLIDWFLFALWGGAIFGIAWVSQGGEPRWFSNPWLGQLAGFSLTTLPFATYFAIAESSRWQGTIGKRALRLRVTTADGHRAPLRTAICRSVVKFVPWELGHVVPYQLLAVPEGDTPPHSIWFVSTLAMCSATWFYVSIWVREGKTPYDRAAGTSVVIATSSE